MGAAGGQRRPAPARLPLGTSEMTRKEVMPVEVGAKGGGGGRGPFLIKPSGLRSWVCCSDLIVNPPCVAALNLIPYSCHPRPGD